MAFLSEGVVAGVEHENLLKLLDCNTIVDIGANKGQFTLVSRKCFPEATIHSFEPLDEPAKKFESLFLSDKNVFLHQVAIGPESKTTEINISAADDSSSLLPITELQVEIYPGTKKIDTVEIKEAPLRDYIGQEEIQLPALLKIDVQGYELESLKGCEDLLNNFSYVYVECSFIELYKGQAFAQDVFVYLNQHGLILKGIYNMSYDKDGNAVQADFMFIKNSRK